MITPEELLDLRNAIANFLAWDKKRKFIAPYAVRDPLHTALTLVNLEIRKPFSPLPNFGISTDLSPSGLRIVIMQNLRDGRVRVVHNEHIPAGLLGKKKGVV